MITKYGYDVFFSVVSVCIVLTVLAVLFIEPKAVRYGIVALAILVFGLSANFFRDPERVIPVGDNLVVSPADGKILLVKNVSQPEFMNSEVTQISIFMSPLNVHVNRNPISGTVQYLRYVKGEYFAAFDDKASEKNEQMVIGMKNDYGKVLFKQIAGFVARRIVCTLTEGETVRMGDRFGMIKFGSRVDVFVPATSLIKVKAGDVAVAGETVLGELVKS